jgi:hypothetical protein
MQVCLGIPCNDRQVHCNVSLNAWNRFKKPLYRHTYGEHKSSDIFNTLIYTVCMSDFKSLCWILQLFNVSITCKSPTTGQYIKVYENLIYSTLKNLINLVTQRPKIWVYADCPSADRKRGIIHRKVWEAVRADVPLPAVA